MNIKGLSDINPKKSDKKDEKKNRTSYVGGEQSGLAVEDGDDFVSKVVAKAQRDTGDDSRGQRSESQRLTITLYADGFVVSDSEAFRPYEEAQNKKFMQELGEGVVPQELQAKYSKGLEVALQDKRGVTFKSTVKPAPPSYFQGEGLTLTGAPPKAPVQAIDPADISGLAVPLAPGQPVHELQVKFPNGERRILQVNPGTPFQQVRGAIQSALKTKNFKVTTPFPAKDITEQTLTIVELDLLDSSVNVSLI